MTILNVDLSAQLQQTLGQQGVWAYSVYFDSSGAPQWTTLVENGAVTASSAIALPEPYNSGKIYFIVQSQDPSQPNNLQTLITGEQDISWNNAATYDFRYDSFEVTLKNLPGDVGNLTSVEGFGLPMQVGITYGTGGTATTDTRGYGITGSSLFQAIADINPANTYVYDYTSGPLQGEHRAGLSPSQAVSVNAPNSFSASDWSGYVTSLETSVANQPISIAGFFNGAPDANGNWHNAGFFSYSLQWDGTNFWLAPDASSQIQGYIKISPANLENSIYSTLGSVEIYTNQTDATPYQIYGDASPEMNTGENNQWGEVLTQFLTGFTAGFYNTTGQSYNSAITSPIDLNSNWNWDPTYAFGKNLTSGVTPTYMDPYSEIYYFNSNSYGSGYSDNLMKQYSVGGPLISVYDPSLGANVSTINLTLYDDGEQPQGYIPPVIYNYIAPGQGGYAEPVWVGDGTNIVMSFANQNMVLADGTPITLKFYAGESNSIPQWQEVTITPPAGSTLWQNWNIAYDSATGTYSASPQAGSSQPEGSILINQIPKAADGVAWYQVLVGEGDAQKTFNLYATMSGSQFLNPDYAGQAGSLAVDGLALVTPPSSGAQTIPTFTLSFAYSGTTTLDPSLLVPNTNTSFIATLPAPNAPVAGTLAGDVFTAVANQANQVSNAITVGDAEVAFGWTGLNSATGTPSWVSGYTNKIGALNVAQISFAGQGVSGPQPVTAVADIDGQWVTSAMQQFGNGTYAVTMHEYSASDTSFATPLGPLSSPLTLTVNVADLALQAAGNGGLSLVAAGGTAGNWVRLDVLQAAQATGATLLLYAVDATGQLIGRDGTVGGAVTLEDAILARVGAAPDDHGVNLLKGGQSVWLGVGEQLRFAVLTGDHVLNPTPAVDVSGAPGGGLHIAVAGLELNATTDNTLADAAVLAGSQRMSGLPVVYLQHGETLDVQVTGSSANTNTLGFVHIDVDAATGDWSVGGVPAGDTEAYLSAVRSHLDPGLLATSGGAFNQTLHWTVSGTTGFYAPVLLTPSGETFVIGENNPGGREQVRMYGENSFGFEDLAYNQGSDFDYNDMIVRLTPASGLFL